MENEKTEPVCGGKKGGSCKWVHDEPIHPLSCVAGEPATCEPVNLLEAEESDFHDCHLIEATAAIKEILAKIPPDPNGRSLSFIQTNMGTLLAWVNHGADQIEGGVTADNDDETVTAALKLKV